MKNILVALAFDQQAGKLIDYAGALADKFQAKLWIIHVAAPDPEFVGYEPGPQYIRDHRADELKQEHKTLQAYVADLKKKGIKAEALLIQGPTVETIVEEARKLSADLIISGSREHSFFSEFFRESTSLELFKKAEIPLLTVPYG